MINTPSCTTNSKESRDKSSKSYYVTHTKAQGQKKKEIARAGGISKRRAGQQKPPQRGRPKTNQDFTDVDISQWHNLCATSRQLLHHYVPHNGHPWRIAAYSAAANTGTCSPAFRGDASPTFEGELLAAIGAKQPLSERSVQEKVHRCRQLEPDEKQQCE
jgi:hypothetical protein